MSAILQNGKPRQLLSACLAGRHVLLQSESTLAELARVLIYPKLRLTRDQIESAIAAVLDVLEMVEVHTSLPAVTVDPDDDRFLELAVDGRADAVVSGDKHLLDLGSFRGIPILTVAQACLLADG